MDNNDDNDDNINNKKVRFISQYNLLKWNPDNSYNVKKSWRERIDMRENQNIEEELVQKHEETYGNKREICSERLASRDMMIQGTINPFMTKNNYLKDLQNQETYLRPLDSNIKDSNIKNNKYLKED